MTIHLGDVPASSTLYIPFHTFSSTGASVTITGLAVTDIEIYKNGSVTQRSSDAGYALLDTDGIDFDGTTGIHGFSIDLSDNTDAGFFSVGGFYWVVVASITVNAVTVNQVAATFRIVAAEAVAGKPKVDVDAWLGTAAATPTVAGVPEVDITHIGGTGVTAAAGIPEVKVASIAANAITATSIASDAITAAKVADGTIDAATFAAGAIDAAAISADAGAELADAFLNRDMSTGTDSGSPTVRTVRQALRFLRNKWSISGTTLTVTKEDDTTASWTSEVTATAGADPITASDPASV